MGFSALSSWQKGSFSYIGTKRKCIFIGEWKGKRAARQAKGHLGRAYSSQVAGHILYRTFQPRLLGVMAWTLHVKFVLQVSAQSTRVGRLIYHFG